MKKKYVVTDSDVQAEAKKTGVDIHAIIAPADGPDSADTAHVAEYAVSFDPSTTAWSFPSGEGFVCAMYCGDTHPAVTPLPLAAEELDDFANE